MNPFRETAEDGVNKTEVVCARIRENAETKRKLIEEREETKRKAMNGPEYVVARFLFTIVTIGFFVLVGLTTNSYIESHKPVSQITFCHDETHGNVQVGHDKCSHPQHAGRVENNILVCTCVRAASVPSGSATDTR